MYLCFYARSSRSEIAALHNFARKQVTAIENKLFRHFASELYLRRQDALYLPHRSLSSEANLLKISNRLNRDECDLTHRQWDLYKHSISALLAMELAGYPVEFMCTCPLYMSVVLFARQVLTLEAVCCRYWNTAITPRLSTKRRFWIDKVLAPRR